MFGNLYYPHYRRWGAGYPGYGYGYPGYGFGGYGRYGGYGFGSNIIGSAFANQNLNIIGSAGAIGTQVASPTVIW